MIRVLIDTNLLLDVLLDRPPWATDSSAIWDACEQGQMVGVIPASAVTDIFYIARRATDNTTARIGIGLCLATFTIGTIDRQVLEQAALLSGSDFEDNVQIACAAVGGLDAIVTRNPAHFSGSPVPVYTPAAMLAFLAQPPTS